MMLERASRLFCLLFLLCATVGAFASPVFPFNRRENAVVSREVSRAWTNAGRLSRGLAPRKPKSLFNPTRVAAREPQSSPVPPTSLKGYLRLQRTSDGSTLGWVDATLYAIGAFRMTTDLSKRQLVTFTPGQGPFDIKVLNPTSPYEYIGFSIYGRTGPIPTVPNDIATLTMLPTNPVPAGSPSQNVGNGLGAASQSAVWSYDPSSRQLTASVIANSGAPAAPSYFMVLRAPEYEATIRMGFSASGPSTEHYREVVIIFEPSS